MNPHQTCGTCIFNEANRCTNEASRYHGAPLKAWNTCSEHTASTPTKAELLARLITCAAALHLRAEKAVGGYKPYFADRAQQCRKWAADLRESQGDVEHITVGLAEFEAMAL